MRFSRVIGFGALLSALLVTSGVGAQTTPAPPGQPICNTIRTCNFDRNAPVRGCLSSYSCRKCTFVPRCQTIAGKRVCDYQARCGWRGA